MKENAVRSQPETDIMRFIGRPVVVRALFCVVGFYLAINFLALLSLALGTGDFYPRLGQFGDQFGFANCTVSLLSACLLYLTYRTQRQELEEERAELRRTREEEKGRQKKEEFERVMFTVIADYRDSIVPLDPETLNVITNKIRTRLTEFKRGNLEGASDDVLDRVLLSIRDWVTLPHIRKFFVALDLLKDSPDPQSKTLFQRMLASNISKDFFLYNWYYYKVMAESRQLAATTKLRDFALSIDRIIHGPTAPERGLENILGTSSRL